MTKVKPIPEGYNSVTPYLFVKGAASAIDYYKNVFGAKERMRMPGPNYLHLGASPAPVPQLPSPPGP